MSFNESNSTQRGRLATYAVAATGTMIAGSSAMADVVIVDITTVNAATSFTIELDAANAGSGSAFTFSNIGLNHVFYGKVDATATTHSDYQQFVATTLVGGSAFLGSSAGWNSGTYPHAQPAADTTAYLGFRLSVGPGGGDSRYGWIEYVNSGGSVTVSRWAYESDLNSGIATPSASTPAVPGLGGLAALACGAAGVRRGRNRAA